MGSRLLHKHCIGSEAEHRPRAAQQVHPQDHDGPVGKPERSEAGELAHRHRPAEDRADLRGTVAGEGGCREARSTLRWGKKILKRGSITRGAILWREGGGQQASSGHC